MDFRNALTSYAKKLENGEDLLDTYNNLVPFFEENGLYEELSGLLEKIYNITKKPILFKKIGDVMLEKLNRPETAVTAYNIYLSLSQPVFYKNYIAITNPEFILPDESYIPVELQNIIDRYLTTIFLLTYLYQQKSYADILELSKGLENIKALFVRFLQENESDDEIFYKDIKEADEHLAYLLAQTQHHNDINKLAIKLDSNNETAYVNIIDDYAYYENYDQALDFYNNVYRKNFEKHPQITSVVDLHWFLSDKYSERGEYYTSVLRQKKAIELELG